MYAIAKIAGRQYRVTPDAEVIVDRLNQDTGGEVITSDVLMVADGDKREFGTPTLPYKVTLEVLEHGRHEKVTSYHFKRRGGRRRTHGHRQQYTLVRVKSIEKGE